MSDPLRTDPASEAADATRDARIERLLLSGLDHYFAGQLEQAINVWTRVVFLERGHGRARAYIERARSALAERQRESEELLQGGLAAYDAGELSEARDLLTRAVERGGPNETAMVFLDRLSRSGPLPRSTVPPRRWVVRPAVDRSPVAPAAPTSGWLATITASAAVVVVVCLGVLGSVSWFTTVPSGPVGGAVETEVARPLPLVPSSTLTLVRARALLAGGMPTDALLLVDGIELADPNRLEADRLRAEIQAALMSGDASVPQPDGVRP